MLVLGTMVVLAATTTWLVWRLADQDRALRGQQIRERLESAADLVAAALREGLSELEGQVAALSALPVDDRPAAAARAGERLADDALIVLAGPAGLSTYPAGRLVYHPTLSSPTLLPPDTFAEGEVLEFRTRQFDRAIAVFRRQADSADELVRAGALLRLARVYRKGGRSQEALATYDELIVLGDTSVQGLPAELLARHAKCALLAIQSRPVDLDREARQLRDRLLSGRWAIDRGAFLHYTEEAETFLRSADGRDEVRGTGGAGADGGHDAPDERRRREALARASGLELIWQAWRRPSSGDTPADGFGTEAGGSISRTLEGTEMLLLWRATGDTMVGLVGGPGLMSQELMARLEPLLARQTAVVLVGDEAGETLARVGVPAEFGSTVFEPQHAGSGLADSPPRGRRTRAETGLPWALEIVSADPSGDQARVAGQPRLLLTVSTLVVILVVAATYFSSRAVARELAVARLQSEFVSAVSHDFRTPLTSLRQVTEALAGERVAAERRPAYYGIQLRAIDRLHRLVEGLLEFGRVEAGGREFEQRPIRIRAWVEGVVGAFQAEVDKRGYAIELSWSGGDPVIEGDEPALTRALWNLLDNAVKYSPDCKTVWVDGRVGDVVGGTATSGRTAKGRDDGDRDLVISVRDRGVGVVPAERRTIFDKFVRGSAAASSASPGTGLGLAMVQHIVQAHGGAVEVDGASGPGSTFRMRLPLRGSS